MQKVGNSHLAYGLFQSSASKAIKNDTSEFDYYSKHGKAASARRDGYSGPGWQATIDLHSLPHKNEGQ